MVHVLIADIGIGASAGSTVELQGSGPRARVHELGSTSWGTIKSALWVPKWVSGSPPVDEINV